MASWTFVNFASGNGLLPDDITPLPELILTSVRSCAIHLETIALVMFMKGITTTHMKITHLKSKPHCPGNNELNLCFAKFILHKIKLYLYFL